MFFSQSQSRCLPKRVLVDTSTLVCWSLKTRPLQGFKSSADSTKRHTHHLDRNWKRHPRPSEAKTPQTDKPNRNQTRTRTDERTGKAQGPTNRSQPNTNRTNNHRARLYNLHISLNASLRSGTVQICSLKIALKYFARQSIARWAEGPRSL